MNYHNHFLKITRLNNLYKITNYKFIFKKIKIIIIILTNLKINLK